MYTYVAWILGGMSHTPVCKGNNRMNLFKLYLTLAFLKLTVDSGNNGIEMEAVEQRRHTPRFRGLAHGKKWKSRKRQDLAHLCIKWFFI